MSRTGSTHTRALWLCHILLPYFCGGFDTSWTIQQWVWLTILPYLDGLLNLMNTWSKNRGCHCTPPLFVKTKVNIFMTHTSLWGSCILNPGSGNMTSYIVYLSKSAALRCVTADLLLTVESSVSSVSSVN